MLPPARPEIRCNLRLLPILPLSMPPDRQAADQVQWGDNGFDRRRFFHDTKRIAAACLRLPSLRVRPCPTTACLSPFP